jgi:hypothetical protein
MLSKEGSMKTLIAIPSCHVLRHYQQVIRETWGKDVPAGVDLRFFLGNRAGIHDSSFHPYAADEVKLDCGDALGDLTKKCVAMFSWALAQGYEYTWKVDLDTLVRPSALPTGAYDWIGGQNSHFASGGAGYGLSKRAMELVVNWPVTQTCAEDLHNAEALLHAGVQLQADARFRFIPGQTLEPEDLTVHLSSVFGWAVKYDTKTMYEVYNHKGTWYPTSQPTPTATQKRMFRRQR